MKDFKYLSSRKYQRDRSALLLGGKRLITIIMFLIMILYRVKACMSCQKKYFGLCNRP